MKRLLLVALLLAPPIAYADPAPKPDPDKAEISALQDKVADLQDQLDKALAVAKLFQAQRDETLKASQDGEVQRYLRSLPPRKIIGPETKPPMPTIAGPGHSH